jgi:hypothetical protein
MNSWAFMYCCSDEFVCYSRNSNGNLRMNSSATRKMVVKVLSSSFMSTALQPASLPTRPELPGKKENDAQEEESNFTLTR